ncbi:hydrogenase [Fontivita pretiosa]|jgi:hydrogenase-4 component E|uniref:hydrogenase n=1 Tax=Fontivita pretiosa TaxID=2989684 RepID=UPI003D1696B6
MVSLLNALLVVVLLLNLFVLGSSRIRALIHAAALQGVVLAAMPLLAHGHVSPLTSLLAIATTLIKGSLIPQMLFKALRDAQIKREVEPIIGFIPSTLLGALGTAASIGLAAKLPLAPGHAQTLIVPAALATVFTGFMLLISRIKAITQAIGYLILENGIFIFGLMLLEAVPFLVELGVLLDLFVGVFVTSIIIHHINREFASLDTRRLSALKE